MDSSILQKFTNRDTEIRTIKNMEIATGRQSKKLEFHTKLKTCLFRIMIEAIELREEDRLVKIKLSIQPTSKVHINWQKKLS